MLLQPSIFPQIRTDTVYGNGKNCANFLQMAQTKTCTRSNIAAETLLQHYNRDRIFLQL